MERIQTEKDLKITPKNERFKRLFRKVFQTQGKTRTLHMTKIKQDLIF